MSTPADKIPVPPYPSFKTLVGFMNELRDLGHVPMQVDRTLMPKLSGSVISEVLSALRYLGVIEGVKGTPTPTYKTFVLASDAERKAVWAEIVRNQYDFLFETDHFDIERATAQQVNEIFRARNVNGSTLTRAIAFFLAAAREGGIKVSPSVKPPTIQRNAPTKAKKEKNAGVEVDAELPKDRDASDETPPDGVHRFELPIPGKPSVVVWIPKELDGEDWDMFRDMFNLYVKRWKRFKDEEL